MEKLGVENLNVALDKLEVLVNKTGVVFEDGKISVDDLFKLPGLVTATNAVVKSAIAAAPEMGDLSIEEAASLAPKLINVVVLIASKFGYSTQMVQN